MFFSQFFSGAGTTQVASGRGGWIGLSGGNGGLSEAGINITPQNAMALTAVQRANTLLAESIGKLAFRVHKKTGEDSRQAPEHPANRVIGIKPNGWMTPFQVQEFKQMSMGTRGNGYALIETDSAGYPVSQYPLHPDRMQVM